MISSFHYSSSDIVDVIHKVYPENPPNILMMGHSMGGAITGEL